MGKTLGPSPLFPEVFPSPWASPEERPRLLREAGLEDLLEGYRFFLRLEGVSPTTAESYAALLRDFFLFLAALGRPSWREADPRDLLLFVEEMVRRGHTPRFAYHAVYALRWFGRFVAWCGATPPLLEVPPLSAYRRALAPPSQEEVDRRLALLESYPGLNAPLLRAVYVLLGKMGLRAKEALVLAPKDLRLPEVRLPGGWAVLPREALPHMAYFLEAREEALRGLPPNPRLLFSFHHPTRPLTTHALLQAHEGFLRFFGLPKTPLRALSLAGSRRLAEELDPVRARLLLRRATVL